MLVKYAGEKGISLPEIMFWRQAMPVAIILAWLTSTGGLARLQTRRLGSHGRRAIFGMFGMVANFASAILLPLAVSTTLGFTTPLFAVILAALVMREHVGPWRWSAVLLGFLGVLVIARPGNAPISPLGAAAGLGAALTVAWVSYQIRDLGRTEEPIRVVFYFSAFGAAMMVPLLPFFMTAHDLRQWLLLFAIGTVGTAGQLLLTASLRFGAVASVIVMDYTSLVWATLYGWAIWDRLPPHSTWLGAPLVIAAGMLVTWREHKLARQISPAAAIEGD